MPSGKRARQQRQQAAAAAPPPVRSKGIGGTRARQASPRALAIAGGVVLAVVIAIVLGVVLSGGSGGGGGGVGGSRGPGGPPAARRHGLGGSFRWGPPGAGLVRRGPPAGQPPRPP